MSEQWRSVSVPHVSRLAVLRWRVAGWLSAVADRARPPNVVVEVMEGWAVSLTVPEARDARYLEVQASSGGYTRVRRRVSMRQADES